MLKPVAVITAASAVAPSGHACFPAAKPACNPLLNRSPRRKSPLLRAMALALVLPAGAALAGPGGLLGGEIPVNTFKSNTQNYPDIARDTAGNFVVVWQSSGQDGSGDGIYAQRYTSLGVAQGVEFRVNTTTVASQSSPSVAMDANGDFVVAWHGPDASGHGIYGQRYNAAGVAQGAEFPVNITTANDQGNPSIAMDATGDFVVAWESYSQDGSNYGVYARRYNLLGVAQSGEIAVNTTTDGTQRSPEVALDADGDFVVAWVGYEPYVGGSGGSYDIFARRYDKLGVAAPQGEFLVNANSNGNQDAPSVASDAAGDFVVAWGGDVGDGNGLDVYARRFDKLGVAAAGGEFQVNTTTPGNQSVPGIALDSDGNFVVAWHSTSQDGSGFGVYGRRYDKSGVAPEGEFRVNTTTLGDQVNPSVALGSAGNLVVAWSSAAQDGSGLNIIAQRFQNPTVSRPLSFNYDNFNTVSGLTFTGNAAQFNGVLRLTPADFIQMGSVWFNTAQNLNTGFTSRFQFQISGSDDEGLGADGFTFNVQNNGLGTLVGEQGTADDLSVQFDTFKNDESGDPSDNFVAINFAGTRLATADLTPLGINLSDGAVHTAVIEYAGTTLNVSVDNQPVAAANGIALASISPALVGFGARTGGAFENHDILNWSFAGGDLLRFTVAASNAGEAAGTANVSVFRSGSLGDAVSVNYATSNGTALAGADYTPTAGILNFVPGQNNRSISIPLTNDNAIEPVETINLALSNPTGDAALGQPGSAIVNVVDDDSTLQFSAPIYNVSEAGPVATITVTRSGSTAAAATVNYATSNGTALAGSDYTATSGTLNFAIGQSSQTFAVPVVNDTSAEFNETINLALSAPGGATLGSQGTAQILIRDNEASQIHFSIPSYSVTEGTATALISVYRQGNSSAPATVQYTTGNGTALAGADYTAVSGTLSFAANEPIKTFTVPISNDLVAESTETVNLTLSNPSGAVLAAPATASLLIRDNEAGQIAFSSSGYSVTEDAANAVITVFRLGNSSAAASVKYTTGNDTALAGSDYTTASGTLNFAANQNQLTFTIPISDDAVTEFSEAVKLTLTAPAGAVLASPGTATLVIRDNEPTQLRFSAATYSVGEATPSATITVYRAGNLSGVSSVNYATANGTALAPGDYTASSGTLNFAANQSVLTFAVPIINDLLVEPNETVNLGLSAPVGAVLGVPNAAGLIIVSNE